jgi:multiple sugar transport system permease protein/raffinose/stachyose/melibiose transport system permease protein/N-acetylglucosamine transport system permease protein
MLSSSFKTRQEIYQNRWFLPASIQWDNYIDSWQGVRFPQYFGNSIFITILAVGTMILVGAMAAYALTQYVFPGRKALLYYFVGGQMIPVTMLLIPLFLFLNNIGLRNSRIGIILVYIAGGLPFVVFLLQGFFRTVPPALQEAARIDGAGEFNIFFKIIMPIAKPALSTAAIFQFMWVWNEFILALVLLQRDDIKTLTVGLYSGLGQYVSDYPVLFAGLAIASIPVLTVYLIFQKQFIRGIAAGAIKG